MLTFKELHSLVRYIISDIALLVVDALFLKRMALPSCAVFLRMHTNNFWIFDGNTFLYALYTNSTVLNCTKSVNFNVRDF